MADRIERQTPAGKAATRNRKTVGPARKSTMTAAKALLRAAAPASSSAHSPARTPARTSTVASAPATARGRTPGPPPGRRLHDNIARGIGIRIAAEELKPGDLLPGEIEAAEQFSVSRTAYREAVRILAAKGMVESRTKTGTRISPRQRWHILDPEVIGWFLETKPSEGFVRDLFGIRQMVEPHAAALAAIHHTALDLDAMTVALDTMARLRLSSADGRAADRAFHQAVLAATGNELIAALGSSVAAAIWWTTLFKHRTQQPPRDPLPEHWAVLDAIRTRDPDRAREAMVVLVGRAFDDMQASLSLNGNGLTRAG